MTEDKKQQFERDASLDVMTAIREDFFAPFAAGRAFADIAPRLADEYRRNKPMQHVVIDGLFDESYLDTVVAEVPAPSTQPGFVLHKLSDRQAEKYAFRDVERLGPYTRTLIDTLNAKPFLEFLGVITGIKALISDCYLGGGFQQTSRGGRLAIHADFAIHPITKLDRRINMLIFLNRDWRDSYGGDLELWNSDMTECVKHYPPHFNKTVIFATNDNAFHGHPEPLNCPADMTRKSLSLFYYTNGRPDHEISEARSTGLETLWQDRPQDLKSRTRD